MKISEAARRSGLPSKTIRYYESIELIAPATRRDNGYRDYDPQHLQELSFLAHAREVGFNLEECRELLGLQRNSARQSAHAKGLVMEKIDQLDQRIEALRSMRERLHEMAARCRGDEGPECAILDDLGRADHE